MHSEIHPIFKGGCPNVPASLEVILQEYIMESFWRVMNTCLWHMVREGKKENHKTADLKVIRREWQKWSNVHWIHWFQSCKNVFYLTDIFVWLKDYFQKLLWNLSSCIFDQWSHNSLSKWTVRGGHEVQMIHNHWLGILLITKCLLTQINCSYIYGTLSD